MYEPHIILNKLLINKLEVFFMRTNQSDSSRLQNIIGYQIIE